MNSGDNGDKKQRESKGFPQPEAVDQMAHLLQTIVEPTVRSSPFSVPPQLETVGERA